MSQDSKLGMLVNLNGKIIKILMIIQFGIELENKGHDFGYSNFSKINITQQKN